MMSYTAELIQETCHVQTVGDFLGKSLGVDQ